MNIFAAADPPIIIGIDEKHQKKTTPKAANRIVTEAKRSPWFNMVKKDSAQNLHLILNDDKNFYNRQEVPEAFDMTTISYVSSPEFIKKSKSIFDGNVAGVYVPAERSLDIDSSLDFEIAEFLLTKNGEPHVR